MSEEGVCIGCQELSMNSHERQVYKRYWERLTKAYEELWRRDNYDQIIEDIIYKSMEEWYNKDES